MNKDTFLFSQWLECLTVVQKVPGSSYVKNSGEKYDKRLELSGIFETRSKLYSVYYNYLDRWIFAI